MIPLLAIIADDLTGAADTAVQACGPGTGVVLLADRDAPAGSWSAIAWDTDSRDASASEAAARAGAAARRASGAGARLLYKKIDSACRGHVGAELAAVLRAGGFTAAVVAPSFPANGRVVVGGRARVRPSGPANANEGAILSTARWTEGPDLRELLESQSGLSTGLLSLSCVRGGVRCVQDALGALSHGAHRLLAADAETDSDLDTLASALLIAGQRILPAGSAGLARAFVRALGGRAEEANQSASRDPYGGDGQNRAESSRHQERSGHPPGHHHSGPLPAPPAGPAQAGGRRALVIAGTAHPATWEQLDFLARRTRAAWVAIRPGAGDAGVLHGLLSAARRVGIVSLLRPTAGAQPPADPAALPALSRSLAKAVTDGAWHGIILTGGATARAVLTALDATGLVVTGEALPGISRGILLGGAAAGLPVVTKSGGFGEPDALALLVERLLDV